MRQVWIGALSLVLSSSAAFAQSDPTPATGLPARPAPAWLSHGIVYQLWLRTFTPEGTLRAAAQRLPAVAALGATVIYLSPVMLQDTDMQRKYWSTIQLVSSSNNPRGPYRIADYDKIDPEYGSEDDLRAFIAKAHSLGLHVLMDLVYFHTGPTNVLMKEKGFYMTDAQGKVLISRWNFPRLNFANPKVREYLIGNMLHWVTADGADGYRCDVAFLMPLDFWEAARDRLARARPDIGMLAESTNKPREQLKAFDASYSFPWYTTMYGVLVGGQPASALQDCWKIVATAYPTGARFIRYDDNHDKERAGVVFGERGNQLATVINFTIDGIPFIYNGQEVGDATPHDPYRHWPIHWEAEDLPHYAAILQWYKDLCKLRRNEPALTDGETLWMQTDRSDSAIAFVRRLKGRDILVVANVSPRPARVSVHLSGVPGEHWQALFGKAEDVVYNRDAITLADDIVRRSATDGTLSLTLGAMGYFVGARE